MKINSILKSVFVVFAFVLVSAFVMVSCKEGAKEEAMEEGTEVVEEAAEVVDSATAVVDSVATETVEGVTEEK